MALTDENGNKVQEYYYNACLSAEMYMKAEGQRKDTSDWVSDDTRTDLIIDRGYTGHEHWEHFDLINMPVRRSLDLYRDEGGNGRVYDPELGRFLSPDPVYQSLSHTQVLNKYSYVINNPLKYIDPSVYSMADFVRDEFHRNSNSGGYINRDLVNWANNNWHGGNSSGRIAAANERRKMVDNYILLKSSRTKTNDNKTPFPGIRRRC